MGKKAEALEALNPKNLTLKIKDANFRKCIK